MYECDADASSALGLWSVPTVALISLGRWDLVIIEGWYGRVAHFIATIRRRNPFAVVVFVCLDTFPSPLRYLKADVDAFVTNSATMQRVLSTIAPTRFMHLAVDPVAFQRVEESPAYLCVSQCGRPPCREV
jgi:hypothetical protein